MIRITTFNDTKIRAYLYALNAVALIIPPRLVTGC